jgi:hypothetical protein
VKKARCREKSGKLRRLFGLRANICYHSLELQRLERSMKHLLVAATVAGLTLCAHASTRIGTLQAVEGIATVSGDGVVTRAASGASLVEGATVLVGSKGKATLVLNNGCVVALGASQSIRLNTKASCEQLKASVADLAPAIGARAGVNDAAIRIPGREAGALTGVGASAVVTFPLVVVSVVAVATAVSVAKNIEDANNVSGR